MKNISQNYQIIYNRVDVKNIDFISKNSITFFVFLELNLVTVIQNHRLGFKFQIFRFLILKYFFMKL